MRTREALRPGALLAFMGQATTCEEDIPLLPGDIVEVISLDPDDDAVTVLVLRGRRAGKVGVVHVDMSQRSLKGWRFLTLTGSVARPV